MAIGLDVGGTSVKAALVGVEGDLAGPVRQFSVPSDADAETILGRFGDVLAALLAEAGARPVAGIGVGMPGPFDYNTGVSLMQGLGKYDALYGRNLAADWRRRLGLPPTLPVRFVNDAAAFALGASRFGPGRGERRVMAVTLGTGCGSAFVVDGEVVAEGEGVPPLGMIYHLPFRGGIIDDWISRRGILRLWAEQGEAPPGGGDVKEFANLARAGAPEATRLFTTFGELLAEALAPAAGAFRPDLLVLGGQIAGSFSLFGGPLQERLRPVPVAVASGSEMAVRGAAGLVLAGLQRF